MDWTIWKYVKRWDVLKLTNDQVGALNVLLPQREDEQWKLKERKSVLLKKNEKLTATLLI